MNIAVPFDYVAARLPGRKARLHAIRVTAVCVAFVGLLATGFHHRRDLTEFFFAATARSALIHGAGQRGQADTLRPHDPRSSLPETRIGLMLFSSLNNDACRRVLFDNRTGLTADAGTIHCGQPPEPGSDQLGQERAQAMLKAFRK